MPRITAIKPQQKRKNRFNIYLDGKFAFGLSVEALAKTNLSVNQELSNQEADNLVLESKLGKSLDWVYRFLSYRPRSEKEIRDYLKKKEVGGKIVEKVIGKIKKLGYLDDLAFARWWIEQRSTFRPRGKIVLRLELQQKGIASEIINEALDGTIDEVSLIKKVVQKGVKKYQNLPPQESHQKIIAYLRRRGFSWEVIKEVLNKK